MKKGSGIADSEGFLKLWSKTLPGYYNNCLWLSILYITKSKIVFVEDYTLGVFFPIVVNFFELKMCIYCDR